MTPAVQTFDFRLRFNLADGYRIASSDQEIELQAGPPRIVLKTGAKDTAIEKNRRAAAFGGPYGTEIDARAAALQAKRALLYWAVERRVGIDFGDGFQRSGITEAGVRAFEEQFGTPVRIDVHGIDTFPSTDNVTFVLVEGSATVGKAPSDLLATFGQEFNRQRNLPDKIVLACELYASSFFDVSHRSRFITLVTAVEAMLDHGKRPAEVQTLVDQLDQTVNTSTVDAKIKQSIKGLLTWARNDSIGGAGQKLAERLLPGAEFRGMSAGDFFRHCYNVRSGVMHRGSAGSDVDMLELSNQISEFVAKLLLASLNGNG
jgi:hypothetical protein